MEKYIRHWGDFTEMEEYDCSRANHTLEEWYSKGQKDVVLGTVSLTYGILIEIMYVPCMMVILRPAYLKMSCYKIMAVLGFIDMMAIAVNSITTGILLREGAVFCTNPHVMFVAGAAGLGLWCAACACCLILVCNRIVELWRPSYMDSIFGKYRTYLVMLLPIGYGLNFTFFTNPVFFASKYKAWFFDPFIYENGEFEYYNIPHTLNNILIVVFTCLLYAIFCLILAHKFKQATSLTMTWHQKSIFIQSIAICTVNLIASLIYVYMQFFQVSDLLIIAGQAGWQLGHGAPAIVYLSVNRTIQREVLKMIGIDPHKLIAAGKTGLSQGYFKKSNSNSVAAESSSAAVFEAT